MMWLTILFISAASATAQSFRTDVLRETSPADKCTLKQCDDPMPPPGQICCGADGAKGVTGSDSVTGSDTCPDGTACCECGDDFNPHGMWGCLCPYVPPTPPPAGFKGVLVAGDSWGTEGKPAFDAMMQKNGAKVQLYNIAVPGSMASDWETGFYLKELQANAAVVDYIWLTLMGNDIFNMLPGCALFHHTAETCGDNAIKRVTKGMHNVLDAIFKVNPKVKVIGFGYDILGLDKVTCQWVPNTLFPQCKNGEPKFNRTKIECFNTQFIRMQGVWEELAEAYPNVQTINLLGTLQAAGGNTKASTGHPDLSSWGPDKYTELNCEHATRMGGFPFIFDKMWELYWSKQNITTSDDKDEVIIV